MPPVSYPDLAWSGRVSRLMRTLQVVAIAGSVGAVGGGIGALAMMGLPGSSPHPKSAEGDKVGVASHPSAAHSAAPAQMQMARPQSDAPRQAGVTVAAQPQAIASKPAPQPQPQTVTEAARTSTAALAPPHPPANPAPTAPLNPVRQRAASEHGPATTAQADQRSRLAEDEQGKTKNLYDRAADEDVANPSNASLSAVPRKRTVKRVNRRAVAAIPPPPQPPIVIVPGRAYPGPGYQSSWRAEGGDSRDWRGSQGGSSYARDDWRDRRSDDGYDRESGPPNPIGALFGFLVGDPGQ